MGKFTLQLDPVKDVEGGNEKGISPAEFFAVVQNGRHGSLFFDIETGPASETLLEDLFKDEKVTLPKHPGKFDPNAVKYGNTKDLVKRQEKLTSEIAKHQAALENWVGDCEKARDEAWTAFVEEAPLSPLAGRVMAIGYGYKQGKDSTIICLDATPNDEHIMLVRLWNLVSLVRNRGHKMISFNGHTFDFPFCRHRSWAYEDINPPNLVTKYKSYEDFCVDALEIYKKGCRYNETIKLDKLARLMGVRRKTDGVTGDMFHKLYHEDMEKALEYLTGDILCLEAVAQRMRIC